MRARPRLQPESERSPVVRSSIAPPPTIFPPPHFHADHRDGVCCQNRQRHPRLHCQLQRRRRHPHRRRHGRTRQHLSRQWRCPGDGAGIHSTAPQPDRRQPCDRQRPRHRCRCGRQFDHEEQRRAETPPNWDVVANNKCLVVLGVNAAAILGDAGGTSPGSNSSFCELHRRTRASFPRALSGSAATTDPWANIIY